MVSCRRRAYSSVWAGSGADFLAPIGRDDEIGQGSGGSRVEDVIEEWVLLGEEGVYYFMRWVDGLRSSFNGINHCLLNCFYRNFT